MAAKAKARQKPKAKVSPKHAKDVLATIRSGFKKGEVKRLSEVDRVEVLPTGIEVLDRWVIGIGGLPIGRVSELYSDPDIGKTSLGLHFIGCAQQAGGIGSLVEAENTIDKRRAPVMGADPEEILLFEMQSMESFILNLRMTMERIPDGFGPNVVVYDSLAASSLESQMASILAMQPAKRKLDSAVGAKARLMSQELPVLASLVRRKRVHLCIINQIRHKIGVMYGSPETTPGGQVTKFQSSLRLQLWRGKPFKVKSTEVGHPITIKANKNKFAKPGKKAVIRLNYDTGFDDDWSMIAFAKDHSILPEDARESAANLKKAYEGAAELPDWFAGNPNQEVKT
jgi:recombination protein RecA